MASRFVPVMADLTEGVVSVLAKIQQFRIKGSGLQAFQVFQMVPSTIELQNSA
jgi:hypothetical protein